MKVLFDNVGFHEQTFGGVSRYLTELIRNLPSSVEPVLAIQETANTYLQAPPFRIPPAQTSFQSFFPDRWFRGKRWAYKILSCPFGPLRSACERKNDATFRHLLAAGDFDVLHLTASHLYGRAWRPCIGRKPMVVTIHDLIPEKIQRMRRFGRERRRMLAHVDRFICVSERTRDDLVDLYGVPTERTDVVYHGPTVDLSLANRPLDVPADFVLYVGGRSDYKNFLFFLEAIAPILRARPNLWLVCTGLPFNKSERSRMCELGIESRCRSAFFPEGDLPALYRKATVFVFPSRYEGFGIPILDAFSSGCPVLLNRTACFPEIAGDAALYFEDGDADGLRRQLERLLADRNLREHFAGLGQTRVRNYSWARAANETARVYERAIQDFSVRRRSCS